MQHVRGEYETVGQAPCVLYVQCAALHKRTARDDRCMGPLLTLWTWYCNSKHEGETIAG